MATIFFSPSPPNQSSSMAANLFPDTCSSPRISFSYILDHHPSSDHVARSDENLSSNDSDFVFDFCLPSCELGSADELFFNGVILPTHIKHTSPNPPLPQEGDAEVTSSTTASLIREEKGHHSKSFWRFMRSSSVNCDSSSHCKRASIWSSLPLLVRSYSTGKLHSGSSNLRRSSSKSKPPLKKAQFGANGSNYSPYIIKGTSDLLGFGLLFCNGNDKKGKKP